MYMNFPLRQWGSSRCSNGNRNILVDDMRYCGSETERVTYAIAILHIAVCDRISRNACANWCRRHPTIPFIYLRSFIENKCWKYTAVARWCSHDTNNDKQYDNLCNYFVRRPWWVCARKNAFLRDAVASATHLKSIQWKLIILNVSLQCDNMPFHWPAHSNLLRFELTSTNVR